MSRACFLTGLAQLHSTPSEVILDYLGTLVRMLKPQQGRLNHWLDLQVRQCVVRPLLLGRSWSDQEPKRPNDSKIRLSSHDYGQSMADDPWTIKPTIHDFIKIKQFAGTVLLDISTPFNPHLRTHTHGRSQASSRHGKSDTAASSQ